MFQWGAALYMLQQSSFSYKVLPSPAIRGALFLFCFLVFWYSFVFMATKFKKACISNSIITNIYIYSYLHTFTPQKLHPRYSLWMKKLFFMTTPPRIDSPGCSRVRSKESEAADKEKGIWRVERLSDISQCQERGGTAFWHFVIRSGGSVGRQAGERCGVTLAAGCVGVFCRCLSTFFPFLSYWSFFLSASSFTSLHPNRLLVYSKSHPQVL